TLPEESTARAAGRCRLASVADPVSPQKPGGLTVPLPAKVEITPLVSTMRTRLFSESAMAFLVPAFRCDQTLTATVLRTAVIFAAIIGALHNPHPAMTGTVTVPQLTGTATISGLTGK